jgi:tRNA pseudouridine55 synthase
VDGRRAYKLARAGRTVDLPPRTVRIDSIEAVAVDWPSVTLTVRCGSGTYIRSLARDIGRALGTHAYLTGLRRTAIGPFRVDAAVRSGDAASREKLGGLLLPPRTVTRAAGLPEVALGPPESLCFVNGRIIPDEREFPDGTRLAIHDAATDRLLGLADYRVGQGLRVAKVLSSAQADLLS